MKWDELPLMMVRDSSSQPWRGPLRTLIRDDEARPYLTFVKGGEVSFCYMQAKPYTEPQPPKMRPMTRDEILAWACSAEALGWVVREDDDDATIRPPQYFAYLHESTHYTRSRASATGDYKWEKFEVEVADEQA